MDTGLAALVAISRVHQIPADSEQLVHQFGVAGEAFTDQQIVLSARSLGLKAKCVAPMLADIRNAALPAIARMKSGKYAVLAKINDAPIEQSTISADSSTPRKVLIHYPDGGITKEISISQFEEEWSGNLIAITKRAGFGRGIGDKFDISWFIPSIVKYKSIFYEVLVASFFLQLFALVTPIFFQVVMDKVLVHRSFSTLNVLAVGFFIIIIFEVLIGGIRNYLFSHTTNRIDVELGSRLYSHLMSLPLAYFESRQVGQNVARVRELDTIRNFITGTALTLIIDLSFVFVFIFVMWIYSPKLTGLVLATLPIFIVLSLAISPSLKARLNEKFKHGAENTSFLTESVSGISTVKSMAVEPQMRRKLEDHLAGYVNASFKSQNLSNVANQIASLTNKMMTLGIIWLGAHLVINNELTVGQLVAFNMLAGRVSSPILKLVQLWQDFQQAGISILRLGDILNSPREPGFNSGRSRLPRLAGEIHFNDVTFSYTPSGNPVIVGLDVNIRPGEVVGIVGRSGSGKSTLTKLVQRLYVPQAGRIIIDGVDIAAIDVSWLRRQIGVVLQENFLFNRSIRENIALADPSIPIEKVVAVAKLSGAHEFIAELPDGYDSIIGEQGSNLSGGQRQRIAIARALINDPRILIFDEATSALDYESEKIIQDNMAAICKGRTVLIIAHRLSAVRTCNRIIVMESGRILEEGGHDELIRRNGYYCKLCNIQSGSKPVRNEASTSIVTNYSAINANEVVFTRHSKHTGDIK